jgi:hypothetical protein
MERVRVTSEHLSRELRRLLSFWPDEQVGELHAAGITVKDRQSQIYELYHGTPKDANNKLSLIEQLCTGLNQFASIFDIELEATTAASSTQNDPTKMFVVKQRLVRQPDMRAVAGTSFYKQSLSGSSNNARGFISGKSLYNYSQDVAKNVRKALSLFYDYMDKDGDGNPAYPSGKTQDDLDVYILTGMYKYLHAKITTIDTDSSETDVNARFPSAVTSAAALDAIATTKVEQGWWHPGFFSFVAFGPQAPAEFRTTRFMITDGNKKDTVSWKKNRDKLGLHARKARDNACPDEHRGVSPRTSKEAAEIAINSQLVEQHGNQNTFLALKTAVNTEMEMYKMLVQTLQIVRDNATLKKETLDDMKRCRGEVLLAKTNLDMFTRACKRKKSNSAVEDYLAKTGVAVKPKTSDSSISLSDESD